MADWANLFSTRYQSKLTLLHNYRFSNLIDDILVLVAGVRDGIYKNQ